MGLSVAISGQTAQISYGFLQGGVSVESATAPRSNQNKSAIASIHSRCKERIESLDFKSRAYVSTSLQLTERSRIGCNSARSPDLPFSDDFVRMPAAKHQRSNWIDNPQDANLASMACRVKASRHTGPVPAPQHPSPDDKTKIGFEKSIHSELYGIPAQSRETDQKDIETRLKFVVKSVELLRCYTEQLKQIDAQMTQDIENFISDSANIQSKSKEMVGQEKPKQSEIISLGFNRIAQILIGENLKNEMEKQVVCLQPMKNLYQSTANALKFADGATLKEISHEMENAFEAMQAFLDAAIAFETTQEKLRVALKEAPDQLADH